MFELSFRLILPYEDQLALVAISTSEAAPSAAECLLELSKFAGDTEMDVEGDMDEGETQDVSAADQDGDGTKTAESMHIVSEAEEKEILRQMMGDAEEAIDELHSEGMETTNVMDVENDTC